MLLAIEVRGYGTQKDFAKSAGISPSQVNRWIGEGSGISPKNLAKLARSLNTTADWLLHGTGNPPIAESVARDTPGGAAARSYPGGGHAKIVDGFLFSVAKMPGATGDDVTFAREKAMWHFEAIFSSEGSSLSDDPDQELAEYLDVNVRKQIERRISNRKASGK